MTSSEIKNFIKKNKKFIIIVCVILAIVIFLSIIIPIISKNSEKKELSNKLNDYLTTECRLNIQKIEMEDKFDYFGDFDGYYAIVYCDNLTQFSYDEMTSILYYENIENVTIKEVVCQSSTYDINLETVYLNGKKVYTKEDLKWVSLKCDHIWSEWKQDEPCGIFEYIRCTICNEEKDWRTAVKRHNYDSKGICVDCKEKVYYFQDEIKNIIQIQYFDVGEYNGAGLSEIKIVFKNTSQKEIEEIYFAVKAYYRNDSDTHGCSYPLNVMPNAVAGNGHYWEPNWPSDMRNEKISSIIITYTDGTKVRIFDDNVNLAFWEE